MRMTGSSCIGSALRGTHHVTNMPDDVLLWRISESPVVNKPIEHVAGPRPSSDGLGRVPVRHIAMQVLVAYDLEQRNLAGIHHALAGGEATDRQLQLLNIRRPRRVTEKLVSRRDPRWPFAVSALR